MPNPMVGLIGASVGSSVIGASSANKAARAQKEASDQQVELQRDIFDQQKQMFSPYLESGNNALAAYNYEMGLGERPTFGGYTPEIEEYTIAGSPAQSGMIGGLSGSGRGDRRDREIALNRLGIAPQGASATPDRTGYRVDGKTFATRAAAQAYANKRTTKGTAYGGFKASPGYDFRLQEGLDATQASVGARHGLVSGASMKAMNEYGQNYASNEYGNYMNRLGGLMGQGQSSAAMTATAGNNYAQGAGNALANYGNAAAAGAIGAGNAIQGGINNGISSWMWGKGQGYW